VDVKENIIKARLERFGEVDPADLKRSSSRKRDKKFAGKKGGQAKKFKGFKRQKLQKN